MGKDDCGADSAGFDRRDFLGFSGAAVMASAGTAVGKAPGLVEMDAVDLAVALRKRKLSARETMGAYLDQIDRLNPKVNAIVALREREVLLAEALEADERAVRGERLGPLHGFPLAVKDLQPTKGIRTTFGSPIFKDFVPDFDSIMVERLRRAGAILIGKTNAPEFGLGSQTYNNVYGATRNAYDQSRTSGGSSGGAAVALALRMLPVADGSDYGGSLRNPAGWNNVYGFRTSYGRVPSASPDIFLPSMGVAGPMARTVTDLAWLLSVQAGYDARAPLSIPEDPAQFAGPLKREVKGLKIAWGGDFGGYLPFEPGVLETCRVALKTFESLGCVVEEAVPDYPIDKVWRAWLVFRAWQEGSGLLAHYNDPAHRALLKPEAIFEVESGMKLSAYDVTRAEVVRAEWYQAVRKLFERYDYFVLPTAQVFPFNVDMHWPSEIAGRQMETYHEWMKVVLPISMTGCPALAVPAGFGPQGLPMGLQIVGPNHAELACLQLAYAYDQATQWPKKRPPALLASVA
ncbi:amidase [Phenylobacterium montanum]|uniref:Amidase n=1 Tax=Phenylobacterium montanum TaxID=2823693 RepID=A0A975G271_9CAUL|nr:amidase [Caulobacter sp. S6]QUD89197.1 amidase [Caulobacter sp. S6]